MACKVYFDHNTVQHGLLGRLLDDASLDGHFSVVLSEAHYVETLLACRAEERQGHLVRVASERRDEIVRRVAYDYHRAIRSPKDEVVIDWIRTARAFLTTLEAQGKVLLTRVFLDQVEAAARPSTLEMWRQLRDDPGYFDEGSYRAGQWCRENTSVRQAFPRSREYYGVDPQRDAAADALLRAPITSVVAQREALKRVREGVGGAEREEIEALAREREAEHHEATIAMHLLQAVGYLGEHLAQRALPWSACVRTREATATAIEAYLRTEVESLPVAAAPASTRLAAAVAIQQLRRATRADLDERPAPSNSLDALHILCSAGADVFCTDDGRLKEIFEALQADPKIAPLLPRVVLAESETELRAMITASTSERRPK